MRRLNIWKLQHSAKPYPPQTTCQALAQPPVQAPPHLLVTAEAAFDFALPCGMPRAGHSHTGRAVSTVLAECCLRLWKSPQTDRIICPPHKPPAQPCHSPQIRLHHFFCLLQRRLDLILQGGMPRIGHSHTGRAVSAVLAECCLLLWKSPQTDRINAPQQSACPPGLAQPPVQAPPHLLHTTEAAFDLAMPLILMPRADLSHTGRALCAVVAERRLLLLQSPQTGKTKSPTNHVAWRIEFDKVLTYIFGISSFGARKHKTSMMLYPPKSQNKVDFW